VNETVVLCEGYYDRAFWSGLLQHLGCRSLRPRPGGTVLDPFNTRVQGGDHAFLSVTHRFLRVRPCQGKDQVKSAATLRLKERAGKPLERLVINVDCDLNADGTPNASATVNLPSMENLLRQLDPGMTADAIGTLRVDAEQPRSHSFVGKPTMPQPPAYQINRHWSVSFVPLFAPHILRVLSVSSPGWTRARCARRSL